MQKSVYDEAGFFELYEKLRQNPHSLNEIVEKKTMLAMLPTLSNLSVLDLGCGMGEHMALYLQQGAKFVAGVDLSQAMLKAAQQKLSQPSWQDKYSLHQAPMETFHTLNLGKFDLITSSFAFHYIDDFKALLANIKQSLKPNGYLVFSQEHPIVTAHKAGERWQKDENKNFLAYRLNHYRDEGERDRNWFKKPFKTYHRTFATIINLLIQQGFILEEVQEPMLQNDEKWQGEFKDLQHRPVLFFVKARRNS